MKQRKNGVNVTASIVIDPNTKASIEAKAKQDDRSFSAVIRKILSDFFTAGKQDNPTK